MPRMPINPNLFMYDEGGMEDVSNQTGLGMQLMGREQIRQRRARDMQQRSEQLMQPQQGFGPLKGLMSGANVGPLPDPGRDGFFGAMQGKENAAQAQGGKFDFDQTSFGNWKQEPLYNPMWDVTQGQSSAVGEAFKDSKGNINYRRRGPLQGLRGF